MGDILVTVILILTGLGSMFLSLSLTLAITMPFAGVLVRYRANYTPKGGVRLQDEEGVQGDPSPDLPVGYFGMMKRVYRTEGWAGLYKGIMPSLITAFVAALIFSPIAFVISQRYLSLYFSLISVGLSVVSVILFVPLQIIINRAICTPHRLAAFAPKAALQVLLSPAERKHPLVLYIAPGVAFAEVLTAFVPLLVPLLFQFTIQRFPLQGRLYIIAVAVLRVVFTTALVTPLQVLSARLTLQRRGPDIPEFTPGPPVYGEDVMQFRTGEVAPYTSLLDCGRKIVREEGARVLTRAWWITALLAALPVRLI
ncbi:hypothetical protein C8R43DRAFT_523902 [Mycena crocata]|nr:hypothetical protein C8R43DRAFT_523902 [Mycena crocata]